MAREIRPIHADELEDYVRLDAYAFGYEVTPEVLERYQTYTRPEWTLAAFEDGRKVAQLIIYPWQMAINGGRVSLGGIADVGAWPEDRRAGHAAALLGACLARMRDQGLAVSMLNPTFYTLYQRFGWAQAAETRNYTFRPGDLRLLTSPSAPAGHAERIGAERLDVIAPVYEASLASANGSLVRDEAFWRARPLRVIDGRAPEVVVWFQPDGRPTGYLIHRWPKQDPSLVAVVNQEMRVVELVALTASAYRGLVQYIARHDLVHRLQWTAPPDDPLPSVLADPIAIKIDTWSSFMLRVVDIVPAFEARGYLPGPPARLTIDLTDPTASWNDGTWRLEVEDGKARASRTTDEPDISTDAGTLAALYNAFLTPQQAQHAALLTATDDRALDTAARIFAAAHPPFCQDNF